MHTQMHTQLLSENKCIILLISFFTEAARLSRRLATNFDNCRISKLWSVTANRTIVVGCFPEALRFPLELIMEQFWIMTHKCESMIFIQFWNENFTTITSKSSDLVLSDAVKEVWSIVFSQCEDLLNRLNAYSLSLMIVDKLFKGKTKPVITNNIIQLCRGVELCRKKSETVDFKWIDGVVERMERFWQLCKLADAARVLLDMRDALDLTGDFQLVENVASQVRHNYADVHPTCVLCNSLFSTTTTTPLQAANSMKNQTLQAIDHSVVTAANFLQDFASDERKRDCLRAYVESKKIVNWITKEIKGHLIHIYILYMYIYMHLYMVCMHAHILCVCMTV